AFGDLLDDLCADRLPPRRETKAAQPRGRRAHRQTGDGRDVAAAPMHRASGFFSPRAAALRTGTRDGAPGALTAFDDLAQAVAARTRAFGAVERKQRRRDFERGRAAVDADRFGRKENRPPAARFRRQPDFYDLIAAARGDLDGFREPFANPFA